MNTLEIRQKYAKENIGHAKRLEEKSKNTRVSKIQRKHAAALAFAIRLGFSTIVEANDAGYSEKLKLVFDSTK